MWQATVTLLQRRLNARHWDCCARSSLFLSPLKGLLSAEQHRLILLRWLQRASGQPRDLELMFPNKDYGICRLLLCLVDRLTSVS